jgi:hypothetical protein
MNKKIAKSIHMKSQSGTKLDIPRHKSLRKSKQRLVKKFEAKRENYKSKRHNELEYNKKTFNCITSCNVIKIIQQDCQKGLFAALCIKCALCMKDFEMRLLESKRIPDDIKRDTNDIYHNSKIINDKLILPNNRNIYVYVPLNTIDNWNEIARLLKIDWLSNLYKQFSPKAGFWHKLGDSFVDKNSNQTIKTKYPKTKQNSINFKTDLSIGKHLINKQIVNLDYSKKEFNNSWKISLNRVIDCLIQVTHGYDICRPNDRELQTIKKIVDNIFKSNLNQINWSRLARTFMGGLFEYEHDTSNIKSELQLLDNLHYLSNLKQVKSALKEYAETLNES